MVSPQHTPPPLDRQQVSRQRGLWWLTMLALLVWNVMAFWPTRHPEVTMPYTTFLAQVRANNVARVHMVGDSMSGADLANLCNEAALITARHNHSQVSRADFEEALDKVILGQKRPRLSDPHERRVVATHEAGHTLVAWLIPAADPVHKVTIVSHGRALGVTEQLPVEERYNYSHTYLSARLAVMLGGRTAEEVVFGDVTTGAENDLIEATRLARRMVMRWGMGALGLVAFPADEAQPFLGYDLTQGREYGEATAARVDQDVRRILEERHTTVHRLLTEARVQLDRLMQALLSRETLDQQELVHLLGPRPALPAPVDGA